MEEEPTLAELFARDPLTYSQQDLDRIITGYREARRHFNTSGKAAKPQSGPVDLKELGLL